MVASLHDEHLLTRPHVTQILARFDFHATRRAETAHFRAGRLHILLGRRQSLCLLGPCRFGVHEIDGGSAVDRDGRSHQQHHHHKIHDTARA